MKKEGHTFLKHLLGLISKKIYTAGTSCEIDPTKIPKEVNL